MTRLQSLPSKLHRAFKAWNPRSLRFRLTIGIATVSAVGLGGVAIWLGWSMKQILIAAHKENIVYLAERMPQDIEIYQEMYAPQEAMQKAVQNLSRDHVFLWIENEQDQLIARTDGLDSPHPLPVSPQLSIFPFSGVDVSQVEDRYWVLCANALVVNQQTVGKLYIAQDISPDQIMFVQMIRNLGLATVVAIGGMSLAGGIYIARSLLPLQRICQLTERISADQLGEAKIELDRAPTEVKQLAERFDEMLMRLYRAWEQQQQFVSDVSHELRTPLTIVSGYLQSLQRRGDNLSPPQREALACATSEADRTIQLLQDLLTLARIDNGQMQFQLEDLCLKEFVQEVITLAEQYHDRAIRYEGSNDSIRVNVDANRLKQVLLNLIDNAVKYSEPEQAVILSLQKQENTVILAVRDQGIGIPFAQQTRIFERFYRVDDARSRSTGGTGLGLSIVKTLVEGMDGKITVSSQLGVGTTFTISLPFKQE
ncbi:integral membrane sensor signal transduction histidine kinase [Halothece sp. PCC 7418]|uniref:sensor histidine kinase n=1 Tax=Halothece sp. (strain PCC 7418) TaxID=65093 RepID=UPI0002A06FEA|nr:ATP-binding protein [Halothece sp. PCC 7418]AFZ44753.1 integral membrane sensor signal transduction histidine kinase [Halothece sp. PCC 7418]